jgi:hypothetical protein
MTPDNPYSPPKADVRDAAPERLLAERPRQVVHATALLWISLALDVPRAYLQRDAAQSMVELVIVLLLTVVVATAVIVHVGRGRNWARAFYLILTVGWFVGVFAIGPARPMIEIALDVVQLSIDVAAMYLLFTKPGALWFRFAPERFAST